MGERERGREGERERGREGERERGRVGEWERERYSKLKMASNKNAGMRYKNKFNI